MTGWKSVKLGDIVTLRSGGTPSKQRRDFWNGTIPWVSSKDMRVLRLSMTEEYVTDEAVGNGTRIAEAGTILLVVRSMILARTVPLSILQRPMAFNQDIKAIYANDGVDQGYVLLSSREVGRHPDKLKHLPAHSSKFALSTYFPTTE